MCSGRALAERRRLLTAAIVLAAAMALGSVQVPGAEAGVYNNNPECPSRLLQEYNASNYSDRCMGGFYQVTQVATGNTNGYRRCSIAKGSANGAGPDHIPAVCGTGSYTITGCYSVAFRYPGVVNHGPYAHHGYWGNHGSTTADC